MNDDTIVRDLALFSTLGTAFDLFHEAGDHWFQPGWAAINKRRYGQHLVYLDGAETSLGFRPDQIAITNTGLGQLACTCHVAIYTAGQLTATIAVTRALGYRIPPGALAAGTAINAITHWALDRGKPLRLLAKAVGREQYLDEVTVVRKPGKEADVCGAGTGSNEMDRAGHRLCGLIAAVVMTVLAARLGGRR